MKLLNAFFVIIFTISAVIQYNDPDPLLWMTIYGYGALVCLLAVLGKDHRVLHYAGILIFLTYALYLFFTPNGVLSWITEHNAENITGSMSDEKPWVEYTRELQIDTSSRFKENDICVSHNGFGYHINVIKNR